MSKPRKVKYNVVLLFPGFGEERDNPVGTNLNGLCLWG